jgi:hypothetical protein
LFAVLGKGNTALHPHQFIDTSAAVSVGVVLAAVLCVIYDGPWHHKTRKANSHWHQLASIGLSHRTYGMTVARQQLALTLALSLSLHSISVQSVSS